MANFAEKKMENMERYAENFSLWAEECVKVIDKDSGREVPFRLNAPQRRVAALMEKQRKAGRPVRVILLKARQWGGSTLVQVYMAWMQLVVRRGWNSVTCAHVKDAAGSIRGMYTRLLRCYPPELKPGKPKDWELVPYEKSASVGYVTARDCQVAIATALSPNAVRGSNFAMAHLSEVAFWGDGDAGTAEEIVRTVSGSVLRCPDSVIVMESTANGKENYFYEEWKRAVSGKSDKLAVFVPWHEIELYRRPVTRAETGRLLASLDDYERALLERGVELEAVAWYHDKRKEYQSHEAMMAEFPSTAEEAFSTSRQPVFAPETVPAAEEKVSAPAAQLAVFIPGEGKRPHVLAEFALRPRLVVVSEMEMAVPLGEAVNRAGRLQRAAGRPLMVVENAAPEERTHARWCSAALAEAGASLVYDEEDRPWFAPDTDVLSEWIDILNALLRDGEVVEKEDVRSLYAGFRFAAPWLAPRIVARLAAAFYCRSGGGATDYDSLL